MKYLLLLMAVLGAIWWLRAKARGRPPADTPAAGPAAPPSKSGPAPMLACAHCGIHIPEPDAQFDGAGRPYCGEAHRRAGPAAR